ncbi:MAG: efflux RND transporter periplasmic adaptor subunit [Gammaproteobacteria bacterium]|nr:efflux RND transporter periplasmic adaptor subunit [Gammaproteobacteria bacterium]
MALTKRYLGPAVVVVAGLALAALIVATGPDLDTQAQPEEIPAVQTMRAMPQPVRMTVTAHGTVMPKTESSLVAEVSGRVLSVSPAMVSGGFFEEGDVLVEIERIDYEVALEQSRANLASAQSELANAEKAYQRQDELTERQSVSESQRDDALNRLTIARASLREANARTQRAERDLERTRLVAPYDGRVRTERIDAGQFVNRGESIATLYSIDFAEVRLPVRDEDLKFLPLSLARTTNSESTMPRVVLRAPFAGLARSWPGRVVRTEGELDPETRMVNLIAQVARPYDQPDETPPLKVGLFVEAEIIGRTFDDIVAVPRSALQAGDRLYVVGTDGRLASRDVEVLRLTGETAYLRGGIAAGETVCLSVLASAIEGQRVRPVESSAPPRFPNSQLSEFDGQAEGTESP